MSGTEPEAEAEIKSKIARAQKLLSTLVDGDSYVLVIFQTQSNRSGNAIWAEPKACIIAMHEIARALRDDKEIEPKVKEYLERHMKWCLEVSGMFTIRGSGEILN